MIKAVIFDMGGVILRTLDKAPRTQLAEKYGMTYGEIDALVFDSESAKRAAVGEILEQEHWQDLAKQLHLKPEELQAFREAFWGGDRYNQELMDFIRGLRPRFRTALLSNAWTDTREMLKERYQALDAFDEVIISSEVKMAKPKEPIYRLTLERLGAQPDEAIFVDDFPRNINAAKAIGIHGVLYRDNEQAIREIQEIVKEANHKDTKVTKKKEL